MQMVGILHVEQSQENKSVLEWDGGGVRMGGWREVLAQEPHKAELVLQGPPLWVSTFLISELSEKGQSKKISTRSRT